MILLSLTKLVDPSHTHQLISLLRLLLATVDFKYMSIVFLFENNTLICFTLSWILCKLFLDFSLTLFLKLRITVCQLLLLYFSLFFRPRCKFERKFYSI